MTIHILDFYRNSNIGIFLNSNEKYLLVPKGLAKTKIAKLSEYLDAEPVEISIGGSRLLGPLIAMNNKGVLVSRLADDFEINYLKKITGLIVERMSSKYTSIGNLISTNDNGVVASMLLKDSKKQITDVFDAPVDFFSISSFHNVGAIMVSTNSGSAIHYNASDEEVSKAASILKVDVERMTINRGLPYLASGIIITKEKAVVGSLTTGPELVLLSRIFNL